MYYNTNNRGILGRYFGGAFGEIGNYEGFKIPFWDDNLVEKSNKLLIEPLLSYLRLRLKEAIRVL